MKWIFIILVVYLNVHCAITSPCVFTAGARTYSPDSTKFILNHECAQGAWDGGRSGLVSILRSTDSVTRESVGYSYLTTSLDKIYWKGSDTIIIEEKFTEFIHNGKPALKDTLLKGVVVKVIQQDPIDSSFTRKIIKQETSPDNKRELVMYKYIKPDDGYYFLNISIINKGDTIPKFGNFFISRYNFDCINDISWDSTGVLNIKASSACAYAFNDDYLLKNRVDVKFRVQVDE